MSPYEIGSAYGINKDGRYFRVTIINIEGDSARVLVQEHSVGSFLGNGWPRKRNKTRGEAVPCATVPITDLIDIG